MPKVIRFHQLGGPEVLRLDEIEVRPPAKGEVRINVRALGLNRAETLFRSGLYIEDAEMPSGLGLEAAGTIETVGPDVIGYSVGDRVAVIPPVSMKQWPVHGELVNVPAALVVPIPQGQRYDQAAATWMAFLTAFGALRNVAALTVAEHVMITAASSSVGLAAIQLARSFGAIPIAITRSARKRDALLAAGADQVIASDDCDVAEAIMRLTNSQGARVIFDAVGGKLIPKLVSATAKGGIIINYGALDPDTSDLPPASLLARSVTLRGYVVHELVRNSHALRSAVEFILAGLATGELRPTIARSFGLEEIVEAHRYLESNQQIGKVVITV